jgi:hypothetical protein
MVRLEPAGEVNLTETWELYPGLNVLFLCGKICELLSSDFLPFIDFIPAS